MKLVILGWIDWESYFFILRHGQVDESKLRLHREDWKKVECTREDLKKAQKSFAMLSDGRIM